MEKYKLEIWSLSKGKTIAEDGRMVDGDCFWVSETEEEAEVEARKRMEKFISNMRFQMVAPLSDPGVIQFLCVK